MSSIASSAGSTYAHIISQLPDPSPQATSFANHPIHGRHQARIYLGVSAPIFREPATAPPWQWPINARAWGLKEDWPSLARPRTPAGRRSITHPIWLGGALFMSFEPHYPAFMYRCVLFFSPLCGIQSTFRMTGRWSHLICRQAPTFVTQWLVDSETMEAVMGPCWLCTIAHQGSGCVVNGIRLPFSSTGESLGTDQGSPLGSRVPRNPPSSFMSLVFGSDDEDDIDYDDEEDEGDDWRGYGRRHHRQQNRNSDRRAGHDRQRNRHGTSSGGRSSQSCEYSI
ncbi:hypothetical protein BCR39DRAFT_517980 [Naematelia encephala]|uniref:Uncharacterized protein n=1 Tax=Naematelia encephala TaxID=71784 RepID=A0A1Y2BGM6_9TREE|nr:hypothetical protein BCR39DRAFT_517980 [Naematelia encephala]